MAFSLTFESVYYATRHIAEPSPALRAAAEQQIPFLHPERTHILSTRDGRAFLFTPLASSEGWYVTYTPKPADVVTFGDLAKGDRFQVFNKAGVCLAPVYTKISKRICKNERGDWLDVALTQGVRLVTSTTPADAGHVDGCPNRDIASDRYGEPCDCPDAITHTRA